MQTDKKRKKEYQMNCWRLKKTSFHDNDSDEDSKEASE